MPMVRRRRARAGMSDWRWTYGLTQQMPHMDPCGRMVATGPGELQGKRGVLSQQLPELQGNKRRAELHEKRPQMTQRAGAAVPETTGRPQLADAYSRGRGVN